MYSPFVRFLLALSSLSLSLPIAWLINLLMRWKTVHIYLSVNSVSDALKGLTELLSNNYLLVIFCVIVILLRYALRKAGATLSKMPLAIKTFKPAGVQYTPVVFTVMAGIARIPFGQAGAYIQIVAFVVLTIVYVLVVQGSYHYNLVATLLFRYHNYEIQVADANYLLLTKDILRNGNQIKEAVRLSHHMLLHTP